MSEETSTKRKVNPMVRCGHCNVGHHSCCPGGVRNGDGSIVLCSCDQPGCRAGQIRCTDCNNREAGTVGTDWHCLNKSDCEAEQERKAQANPTYLRVRAIREAHGMDQKKGQGTTGTEKRTSSSRAPRSGGRECLCGCGATTAGGRFKPGHDSTYLNQLVEASNDEAKALAYAVSDAFGAKYEKRTTK